MENWSAAGDWCSVVLSHVENMAPVSKVVNANSVNCFKSLIDNYFHDSRFSFV